VDVWALWRRIFDAGAPGEGASTGGSAEASAFASSTHGTSRRASAGAWGREAPVEATVAALGAERSDALPPPGGSQRLPASPAAAKRSVGTAAESEREAPHGPASDARAVAHEAARPGNGAAPAATVRTATAPAGSIAASGPAATDAPMAAVAFDAAARHGAPFLFSAASSAGGTARAAGAPDADPCDRDSRAAREAVHVRCQADGSVAVVVRDATLQPALAVRWSLETAYALRGEHAALHRVTLNGRTVYLRGAAPAAPPAAAAGLCFAC
jgi:hypothetical protein